MNKFLSLVLLILSSLPAMAGDSSPIMPEVNDHLNAIEATTGSGTQYVHVARFVFDTTQSGMGTAAAHGLGVYLPANAFLVRGWMTISRHFDSSGTIALSCEDANNIFTATDLSIANYTNGTVVRLAPQDTLATVVKGTTIAAKCEITATISAPAHTTGGKLVGFLEYYVSE